MHCPAPHEYVAVKDTFGESGKPMDLLEKYGLNAASIIASVKKLSKEKHDIRLVITKIYL